MVAIQFLTVGVTGFSIAPAYAHGEVHGEIVLNLMVFEDVPTTKEEGT